MNLIATLLPPSNILLDLEASSKKRVFEQLGILFENNNGIARGLVFDCLFAREKLGSTGLGKSVAIPHGRIKGLKETLGAFIRLKTPLPFDAPDGQPVSLIFALLAPEETHASHLTILAQLSTIFSEEEIRCRLLAENDICAIHQIFSLWQPDDTIPLNADSN